MKNVGLVICVATLLAGCVTKPDVSVNRGPATVQTGTRSEPVYYNGKTYHLDYTYTPAQGGVFDMKISGLSPKQQQDAMNIAISSLGYFACPDGQRGKIRGLPIYVDRKWNLFAQCGVP
jgi:hypothetical protein